LDFFLPGSAEAENGCGGKSDSHLMASCVRNINVKNYLNPIIFFKLQLKMLRMFFFPDMVYMSEGFNMV